MTGQHVNIFERQFLTYRWGNQSYGLYFKFMNRLRDDWEVVDEGPMSDLLGIEFSRKDKTIELRQTAYIEKLKREFFPDGVPSNVQSNKLPCATPSFPFM